MTPYEVIEHTADAGIAASGGTRAAAFAAAAEGMYSLMVDPSGVRERESREIAVQSPDVVRLLERWLLELLYLTDTEGMLFGRFEVSIGDGALRATAWGEPMAPERHELRGDIKGVTRHMTEIEEGEEGVRVRVLFDM